MPTFPFFHFTSLPIVIVPDIAVDVQELKHGHFENVGPC